MKNLGSGKYIPIRHFPAIILFVTFSPALSNAPLYAYVLYR